MPPSNLILGHANLMTNENYKVFDNLAKIYGPVFRLKLGVDTLILNNWKSVQEAFITNGEAFSGRIGGEFSKKVVGKGGKKYNKIVDAPSNENKLIFLF